MRRPYRFAMALLLAIGVAVTGCGKTDKTPPNAPPTQGDVAVLVVDDFGLGKTDYGDETKFPDENCIVGSTDVGSNGADDGLPSKYPHGELVYKVLRDQLSALTPTLTSTATTPRPAAQAGLPPLETKAEWKYRFQGTNKDYRIRLVAAHASGYRTQDVLDEIGVRLNALKSERQAFHRFVINLSFVVIPCNVIKWLDDSEVDGLLVTYNEMLAKDERLRKGLADYTDDGKLTRDAARRPGFTVRVLQKDDLASMRIYLVSAFYRKVSLTVFGAGENKDLKLMAQIYADSHWLRFRDKWIKPGATTGTASPTSDTTDKVIPVGAAGNGIKLGDPPNQTRKALRFPFAPGLWEFVVSASAFSEWKEYDVLNSGEVKLDGHGPSVEPLSFGTSFAAPKLSALEAIYLLKTGRVVCDGHSPPLGYVDLKNTPVDVTTNSPWQNKTSWEGICNDFPQG